MRLSFALVALVACSSHGNGSGPDASRGDGASGGDAAIDAPLPGGVAAIPLTSPDGSFWGPKLTIGSQMFLMDLDTGSTTIGVAGKGCSSCATAGVTPLYMPGAAATDQHQTSSTQYADGSGWSGEIWQDATGLAFGTPSVPLALVDITTQTQFFLDNSYQGILGMGAPDNAEPNTGAYFQSVTQHGITAVMSFELCDATGTMWLGGFDSAKASAAPLYTPLVPINSNQPFYAIDITSMAIGTTSVGTGAATFQQPVVDTGTTLFYVPTPVDTAVLAAINASAGYKALFGTQMLADGGCVTKAGVTAATVDQMLPPLVMTMPAMQSGAPDIKVTVKPMLSYLYDGGGGMFCYAMADGGTQDATTMGDTIMRAFVTVIDLAHQQVGWAPDVGCGGAPRRPIAHDTFVPHPPHHPHPRVH